MEWVCYGQTICLDIRLNPPRASLHRIGPHQQIELIQFDLSNPDRYYWRVTRRLLVWLSNGSGFDGDQAYRIFRHYHHLLKQKSWREAISDRQVVEWADTTLRQLEHEFQLDYCDNHRVARVRSAAQKRRYRRQQQNGCCGSVDFTARGPDGHWYRLGLNYGH